MSRPLKDAAPNYNFVTPYDNWPATQTNLTRKSK